jgi:ceramide glucosyltransferase
MSKRLRYTIETLLVNALIVSTFYQLLIYLANRLFWRKPPPPPAESAPPVSAIVPLRGKSLDTFALLHVLAISGPTDNYEVILVLESDDDPAYPVAQAVADSYPDTVRLIVSGPAGDHVGKIHNLNAGYQAARGDLIAFIDADVQVNAELWNAALATMENPDIGAAFAPPLVVEPERRSGSPVPTGGEMLIALHTNHAQTAELPFLALRDRVHAMMSGFMIFRRDALEQAGGLLHLLDEAAEDICLGRVLRENNRRIAVIPVPAHILPEQQTFNDATDHLLRCLTIERAYDPGSFVARLFTNPLTVGFLLSWITEHEGRWWGQRTWWGFAWLRVALAYELDRVRFGRAFKWTAYAQLFMMDTFISPALWARALFRRTFSWRGRTYRIAPGGKTRPIP